VKEPQAIYIGFEIKSRTMFRIVKLNAVPFPCRGLGREGKGREGKGREGKGREGKGREGKGKINISYIRLFMESPLFPRFFRI
jgi:hypothetical protein